MENEPVLEVLKKAILLEKRANAFYTHIYEQLPEGKTSLFFKMMADEENQHVDILSLQFRLIKNEKSFDYKSIDQSKSNEFASKILAKEIKNELKAASYEAAAISAAIALEEKAIQLYTKRANETKDPDEQAIYQWLANWEKTHQEMLMEIEEELKESIWYDNQFWPF